MNNFFTAQNLRVARVTRFAIVGVVNTCFSYVVSLVAIYVFQLDQFSANLIGFIAGIPTSFLGHLFFTFQKTRATFKFLLLFLGQVGLTYATNFATLSIVLILFEFPPWLVQLMTQGIAVIFSYMLNGLIFETKDVKLKAKLR